MKKIFLLLFVGLMGLGAFAQNNDATANEPLKVVFQLTTADTMSHKALMKQLGNMTTVQPNIVIEVVCHGPGLDMLRTDKSVVAAKLEEFAQKGVVFNACQFSMKERNVSKAELLPFVKNRGGWHHLYRNQAARGL